MSESTVLNFLMLTIVVFAPTGLLDLLERPENEEKKGK